MTKPTQNKPTTRLNRNEIIEKFRGFDRPAVNAYAKNHKNANDQDVDHTPAFIVSLEKFLVQAGTSLNSLAGHATDSSILKHQSNFIRYMNVNSTMRMRNSSQNRGDNQDRLN